MHLQMSVVDCSWLSASIAVELKQVHVTSHVISGLGLPEANVLGRKTNNVALVVHDTGTGTAGADIDADVVVDMRVELVARVSRHLTRLLPRGRSSVGKRRHGGQQLEPGSRSECSVLSAGGREACSGTVAEQSPTRGSCARVEAEGRLKRAGGHN